MSDLSTRVSAKTIFDSIQFFQNLHLKGVEGTHFHLWDVEGITSSVFVYLLFGAIYWSRKPRLFWCLKLHFYWIILHVKSQLPTFSQYSWHLNPFQIFYGFLCKYSRCKFFVFMLQRLKTYQFLIKSTYKSPAFYSRESPNIRNECFQLSAVVSEVKYVKWQAANFIPTKMRKANRFIHHFNI